MGHMRIGFLPRSKQWNEIVNQLSLFGGDPTDVHRIAEATLSAIQNNYKKLPDDESIIKAVRFLAILSYSANQSDQENFLNKNGYSVDSGMTLFSILSSAQQYISTETGSLEVNKMARDAAMKAVMVYHDAHKSNQTTLFSDETENTWRSTGTGAAFCELARTFVAEFTDRQLRYCIEREAPRVINDLGLLRSFSETLSSQSTAISNHALDTSKLMQSWAAGWYNNNSISSLPSDVQVRQFVDFSFRKMREEFRREVDGQ
ncbi:MAG TPA: hypothetical protein DEQ02_10255 [Ruminococcaceae bacterium]|nr:hypothetical protein [Oscillospiraceae bacterium]